MLVLTGKSITQSFPFLDSAIAFFTKASLSFLLYGGFIKGRVKFIGTNTFGEKVDNVPGMHDSMIVIFNNKKKTGGLYETSIRKTNKE